LAVVRPSTGHGIFAVADLMADAPVVTVVAPGIEPDRKSLEALDGSAA
jgi:hypothetical protein